jgi:hypothetical protein
MNILQEKKDEREKGSYTMERGPGFRLPGKAVLPDFGVQTLQVGKLRWTGLTVMQSSNIWNSLAWNMSSAYRAVHWALSRMQWRAAKASAFRYRQSIFAGWQNPPVRRLSPFIVRKISKN